MGSVIDNSPDFPKGTGLLHESRASVCTLSESRILARTVVQVVLECPNIGKVRMASSAVAFSRGSPRAVAIPAVRACRRKPTPPPSVDLCVFAGLT